MFWATVVGAPFALGAILIAIGLDRTAAKSQLWSSLWFDGGVAAAAVGAGMLVWALVLYQRHQREGRLAERAAALSRGSAVRAVALDRAHAAFDSAQDKRSIDPLTPLEEWLQERLAVAATSDRQRAVRGDQWYLNSLQEWDSKNAFEMAFGDETRAPELVDRYREDPRHPGRTDGTEPPHTDAEREAYFDRRRAWLKKTFSELRTPSKRTANRQSGAASSSRSGTSLGAAAPIPPSAGPTLKLPPLPAPSRGAHAFLALNEQRERGERLLRTGQDDEPQKYTALIRMQPPSESLRDKVTTWENETAAMLEVHVDGHRARNFRSDDGLPGHNSPEAVLQRRLYRLEEIMRKLSN